MEGLVKLRKQKGLSQVDLALAIDVDSNSISRYERGVVKPTVEMAQKFADFFNVSVDELLNGPRANEWKINIVWEVDDLNALEIKPNEFTVGFKGNGDFIFWGSIPSDRTVDEVTGRIRKELDAAMAGKEAYEARKRNEG